MWGVGLPPSWVARVPLVVGNPALNAGVPPGAALGHVCLIGSWRTPSLTWWASWPREVVSGGECPRVWAFGCVQVGSLSGFCQRGGAGEIWSGGLCWFASGGHLNLSPVMAPIPFCHPYQHPRGSSVGGSLDFSEVSEVSCWTGQGLLALQAAEVF